MTETTININESNKIHAGDILCGDFGCTMTLPAFYRVLSVTPSGKSAKVQRLSTSNVSSDGGWTGTCVPIDVVRSDEVLTRRIRVTKWNRVEPREYVYINDHMFDVWDGTPQYFDHWD